MQLRERVLRNSQLEYFVRQLFIRGGALPRLPLHLRHLLGFRVLRNLQRFSKPIDKFHLKPLFMRNWLLRRRAAADLFRVFCHLQHLFKHHCVFDLSGHPHSDRHCMSLQCGLLRRRGGYLSALPLQLFHLHQLLGLRQLQHHLFPNHGQQPALHLHRGVLRHRQYSDLRDLPPHLRHLLRRQLQQLSVLLHRQGQGDHQQQHLRLQCGVLRTIAGCQQLRHLFLRMHELQQCSCLVQCLQRQYAPQFAGQFLRVRE